jgi:probable phosphoglycerate mutase
MKSQPYRSIVIVQNCVLTVVLKCVEVREQEQEMEFYFVRHGESEANKNGVIAGGGYDAPLTDLGRHQAIEAQKKAHALNFHAIYHSPMMRAHDTAKIINQTKQVPMNLNHNLKEWDIGDWHGITQAELTDRIKNQGLSPENGESYKDFCNRTEQTIQSILDAADKPFMIVAHAGTFVALTERFSIEHNIKPIKNCAIIHCEFTSKGWYAKDLSA